MSNEKPEIPGNADFAIYINFQKGEPNPQRIFQSADAMIRSIQKLDKILCNAVDSNIEPLLMLEDIEAGSLKIWLKNLLEATDDQAIRELDWKPQVGKYLLKAKYAYIKWVNKQDSNRSIMDLSKEIQNIASETDIKHVPYYNAPSVQDLISVTLDIEKAKSCLGKNDSISYLSNDNEKIDFNLSIKWTPEELSDLITRETISSAEMPIIFAVKKPDYLGTSKWELRLGKKSIHAKIEDEHWLKEFQNRKIDVRPGDSLRCKVIIEQSYGYDNELVNENYRIIKVEKILENQYKQPDIFDSSQI